MFLFPDRADSRFYYLFQADQKPLFSEDKMTDSAITKLSIADVFKKLMCKKAFEKITISDITTECGLNRQTFYYHFRDKYELLNWIFYNEAITPFMEGLSFDNWSSKLCDMLRLIYTNSKFYTNALKTYYGEEFKSYMHKVGTSVFSSVVDHVSENYYVADDDKQFIAEFFSYGMIGTMVAWVQKGMKDTPETVVAHIENLVNDCQRLAIARYMMPNKKNQDRPYNT